MRSLIAFSLMGILLTSIAYGETETIVCEFKRHCSDDGTYNAEEPLALTFVVDYEKDLAYISGKQSRSEVMMIKPIMGGVSFVEITESRNVRMTTIDENGTAVHSRNTIIMGRLVPVQFYGRYLIK